MDETTRRVAWAIAEAWWRKTHRRAAGSAPEAATSTEYADNFWQGFCDEARAAIAALDAVRAEPSQGAAGSAILARIA
jgi:hypothetical protein